MSLRSGIGVVRRRMWSTFYKREIPIRNRGPIVTFTFDDFPRSAFLIGAPTVERYGGHATYYVSLGRMGTKNNLGEQFWESDLRSLAERGHEIASHTLGHSSAQKMSYHRFERDVLQGVEALQTRLGTHATSNFAYPYGEVTLTAKRKLGRQLGSCRSTCPGLNGPSIDLNFLRANALYGGVEGLGSVRHIIEKNERSRGWLIFYTHDVSEDPSPYGCTSELLEGAVSYASIKGSRLLSVEKVLSELRSENSSGQSDRSCKAGL